jgi:alanine dehydrogenase
MPGSVPRTASQALSAAIAPYAGRLADGHLSKEWRDDPGLVRGINVEGGKVTHPALMA